MFTRKKIVFSIAAVLASSTALLAECPSSIADTADGVHVMFSDFHVRFDRQADGTVIEEENYFTDGAGVRFHSLHGAFVLSSWDLMNGAILADTQEVTVFADGVPNLPLLAPGQSWSGQTVRSHDDGTVYNETVGVAVQSAISLNIGSCSYSAWPLLVTTTDNATGEAFVDELTYLPSLGFAIYHGGATQGESFARDEAVGISTEPLYTNDAGALMVEAPSTAPQPGNPVPAPTPGGAQPGK